MHPALSVIFFTVVSGAGYGLLILLGIILVADPQSLSRVQALATLATGSILAVAGLTSSLFHLGQPQRAWRALSQWRSSWLSREGVASFCSFLPIVALAYCLWSDGNTFTLRVFGATLATAAIITIYCTSKIYTSLKTIHAWHNGYVLPGYLLFALLGGSSCLWMLQTLIGSSVDPLLRRGLPLLVITLALISAVLKLLYWRFIDTTRHPATVESATGLGRFGSVRSVEAPHTEENYLTHEMGFVLARKHSARLRRIAVVLFGAAPMAFAMAALMWPALGGFCACLTFAIAIAGIFVERWLFFAEARHVVMLYYHAPARA
jgi:sulfite dehydrogenase (quinone) subunit SoeC